EAGADVYRDDEDEKSLLLEEVVEHLGAGREKFDLREIRRRVDLDRSHHERRPRQEQKPQERALLQHGADAGLRDHRPRLSVRRSAATVAAIPPIVTWH